MAKGRTQPLIYKKLIGLRRMREIRTYGRNTTSYLDRFPPVTSREPGVAKVPHHWPWNELQYWSGEIIIKYIDELSRG